MAQQKIDNKGENQVCTKVKTNLVAYRLFRYCVNLGSEQWVEQFVITELYNELKLESITIKVNTLHHCNICGIT
jgi:hypothetical protein